MRGLPQTEFQKAQESRLDPETTTHTGMYVQATRTYRTPAVIITNTRFWSHFGLESLGTRAQICSPYLQMPVEEGEHKSGAEAHYCDGGQVDEHVCVGERFHGYPQRAF